MIGGIVLAVVEGDGNAEIGFHELSDGDHLIEELLMIDIALLDASLVADDVDGCGGIGADGMDHIETELPVVVVLGEDVAGLGLDERAVEVAEEDAGGVAIAIIVA